MAFITRWDPFGDFKFPIAPFRRMFAWSPLGESLWRFGPEEWWPKIDAYDEGDDMVIKAEVPGMSIDDISVTLEGDTLTIRGRKEREEEVEDKDYYRMERSYGSFMRSIPVPEGVKESDISASYSNGVLEVRLKGAAKISSSRRKAIPIKAITAEKKSKTGKSKKEKK